MRKQILFLIVLFFATSIYSQVSFTANDTVPPFTGHFRLGVNPGYYNHDWKDSKLADIAAGNPALNIKGAGIKTFRIPLPEHFVQYYSYDVRMEEFDHYKKLGMDDLTVFVGSPSESHRDPVEYCSGKESLLFANMYLDIWDNGENGTPVNDENYYALYVYRLVVNYGDHVRFWEILNEPDADNSGNAGKNPGEPGNWWENVPDPCDYVLKAPVFHYIRLLRISYEVIKYVSPDDYIAVGGLGHRSFLDLILRHSDNPVDGSINESYPLTGGAYFDVLSFHKYPHYGGSMRDWDNDIDGWRYFRHSDSAVKGILNEQEKFKTVLYNYGYDGINYPEKKWIITESNLPRKNFEDFIGSEEAQRNFLIKALVACQQNDIIQFDIYKLAEKKNYDEASSPFDVMGLYKKLKDNKPYEQEPIEAAFAGHTYSSLLFGFAFDFEKTELMQLPDSIKGGAFKKQDGSYIYVLWAKTNIDMSEEATGIYSFPESFNIHFLQKRYWNDPQITSREMISPSNIELSGDPAYFIPSTNSPDEYVQNLKAAPKKNDILLYWTTEFEKATDYFLVDRSRDKVNWIFLTKVQAVGDSTHQAFYHSLDTIPLNGITYYRLRQVNTDNSFEFSNIAKVYFGKEKILIYPNPASNEVNIYNALEVPIEKIEIIDASGKLLKAIKYDVDSLDISFLSHGIYILRFFAGEDIIAKRLIVD